MNILQWYNKTIDAHGIVFWGDSKIIMLYLIVLVFKFFEG